MLRPDGKAEQFARAPRAGEIFRNPTLARTFRTLAAEGKKGFYTGRVANAIIEVAQMCGSHLTLDDLKSHIDAPIGGTQVTDPISLTFNGQGVSMKPAYKSVELWEHPPNGQGLVALIALGILQELERSQKIIPMFSREDHNSVPYLHAVIESLRIAFADGKWWISDPDFGKPEHTANDFISPEYLKDRANLFNPDSACDPRHGNPEHVGPSPAQRSSDTVYFAVTDREGNGISFINSNYAGFGTGIIPAGCGFTLQNRGANFTLQPEDHPNVYAGGKRPYHTIIPALLTTNTVSSKEGTNGAPHNGDASQRELLAVYGVMGGFMQPQGHLQVLLNMEVFGMNPQQALDAPRICVGPGFPDDDDKGTSSSTVYLEEGIEDDVVQGLRKLGHDARILRDWERGMFGRGQVIRQHFDEVPNGYGQSDASDSQKGRAEKVRIWAAGSDLRGDGCALPAHL